MNGVIYGTLMNACLQDKCDLFCLLNVAAHDDENRLAKSLRKITFRHLSECLENRVKSFLLPTGLENQLPLKRIAAT